MYASGQCENRCDLLSLIVWSMMKVKSLGAGCGIVVNAQSRGAQYIKVVNRRAVTLGRYFRVCTLSRMDTTRRHITHQYSYAILDLGVDVHYRCLQLTTKWISIPKTYLELLWIFASFRAVCFRICVQSLLTPWFDPPRDVVRVCGHSQ